MAPPHYTEMTVEEYLDLDERDENVRYEYIDGQIRMLAGGSPAIRKLVQILRVYYTLHLKEDIAGYSTRMSTCASPRNAISILMWW